MTNGMLVKCYTWKIGYQYRMHPQPPNKYIMTKEEKTYEIKSTKHPIQLINNFSYPINNQVNGFFFTYQD